MLHGTRQLALIYRVYYKCIRTNMSIQAIDKRKVGETTLIQTTDVRSKVQVPRTLKWFEVTFPTSVVKSVSGERLGAQVRRGGVKAPQGH